MNQQAFHDYINTLPEAAQSILHTLPHQQGRLDPEQVIALQAALNLSLNDLLKALLPIAAALSICPISHFSVGAIVEGFRDNQQGPLYFGANLETEGQPLKVSVHAEQSAIATAWHQGETRLKRLIVNEAPCGHCRQFIKELREAETLDIRIGALGKPQKQYTIDSLLPAAFGPGDLGQNDRLLDTITHELPLDTDDRLTQAALGAANMSYAPYSGCMNGLALQMSDGTIITGRYAENAAFNPSLTAIDAAKILLRLHRLAYPDSQIVDAVMIEKQCDIQHQTLADAFIHAENATLRYINIM